MLQCGTECNDTNINDNYEEGTCIRCLGQPERRSGQVHADDTPRKLFPLRERNKRPRGGLRLSAAQRPRHTRLGHQDSREGRGVAATPRKPVRRQRKEGIHRAYGQAGGGEAGGIRLHRPLRPVLRRCLHRPSRHGECHGSVQFDSEHGLSCRARDAEPYGNAEQHEFCVGRPRTAWAQSRVSVA